MCCKKEVKPVESYMYNNQSFREFIIGVIMGTTGMFIVKEHQTYPGITCNRAYLKGDIREYMVRERWASYKVEYGSFRIIVKKRGKKRLGEMWWTDTHYASYKSIDKGKLFDNKIVDKTDKKVKIFATRSPSM